MTLLERTLTERVPAHQAPPDAAEVRMPLVAEWSLAGAAFGDEQVTVAGAGGDRQEPPRGLPCAGLGEAGGAEAGPVRGDLAPAVIGTEVAGQLGGQCIIAAVGARS